MAEKKYLDLVGLGQYDAKIKAHIKAADDAVLELAKEHANGLADNYDVAGAAATAKSEAVAYTDSKVSELNTTIAGVKTTAEKGVADAATAQAAADAAQGEVDALEAYVGTFTASEGVDTVVKYIDAKTANIASSDTVSALDARVTQAEKDIDAIEADYLKAADKTELQGKINTAQAAAEAAQGSADAVQAEMDAFKLAAEVGDAAVDTLKEIQNYITTDGEAAKAMTESIAANAKAIEDEVARATKAEGDIETAYKAADTAQVERIAALEAKFTGDDSVAKQISDAVAAEAALRESGDAAAEASAAAALKAAQDAQGEVDALEGVVSALDGVVATKAAQADHEALAGRVTTAEGKITTLEGASHSHGNKTVLDDITATLIADWNEAHSKQHSHSNEKVLNSITTQLVSNWNAAEGNAKSYTNEKIAEFVAIQTGEIDALFSTQA